MDKSGLLRALQTEIQKDNLSTFMHEEQEGRLTGCSFCASILALWDNSKFRLTDDVLPPLPGQSGVRQI
jgi:hypothetical protein